MHYTLWYSGWSENEINSYSFILLFKIIQFRFTSTTFAPVSRFNFPVFPESVFRHGQNKVAEEQRLNNLFSWFIHGLDDDFHKRCLNLQLV